jgi:hypothetical protein
MGAPIKMLLWYGIRELKLESHPKQPGHPSLNVNLPSFSMEKYKKVGSIEEVVQR